jgi:RecB family exonuclease
MIKVFSYVKLSALANFLSRAETGGVIYMLPSRSSEPFLLDMLRREGSYFGERPAVWSWQELYAAVTPKNWRRRCIDPPDHNLILKFVTDRAADEIETAGFVPPPFLNANGFVEVLGETTRELMLESVEPDALLTGAESEGAAVSREDLMFRLYADYLLYLESNGLADNAQIPSLAEKSLREKLPPALAGKKIRWVGFMSFTGAQRKLISSLRRLGAEMEFFMPDSGGAAFEDAASQLGADAAPLTSSDCEISRLIAADAYGQYEAIARTISEIYADADVGILTSPSGSRFMAAALARYGIPSQSRSEVTVDKTVLMDIAEKSWETLKLGWPPARTAQLLSYAPLGVSLDAERVAKLKPEGLPMWKDFLSGDPVALDSLRRVENFCALVARSEGATCRELLEGFLALSGDGEWERRLSEEAGDDIEMDLAVREISSSRIEISQKLAMMEELVPAVGEAASVRFAGDAAIDFLRSWGAEAATALAPPALGAVSLYDSPPPALASHGVWIMTDVDASRYPGPVSEHSLLGEDTRNRLNENDGLALHLPTLHEKRLQREALFRRLLAVGEEKTIIIRASSDENGNPVSPSPFVAAGSPAPGWKISPPETAGGASEISGSVPRGPFPRFALYAPPPLVRVPISSIDTALACPFAFWRERFCAARGRARMDDIIDPLEMGVIMHEIWAGAWNIFGSRGGSIYETLLANWDGLIERASANIAALSDKRSASRIADLKGRMLRIAEAQDAIDASLSAAGMKRIKTEMEYVLPAINIGGVSFTGRADRVDFRAGERGETAVLFDYKLGSTKKYKRGAQLAAYSAALRQSGLSVAGCFYLCHGDGKFCFSGAGDGGALKKAGGVSSAAPSDEETLAALEQISALVASGRYEANYESDMCPRCEYAVVCRRGERYGEYETDRENDGENSDESD